MDKKLTLRSPESSADPDRSTNFFCLDACVYVCVCFWGLGCVCVCVFFGLGFERARVCVY